MVKIISVTYRRETGKSPYKWFLGFRREYTKDYVNWLIRKINENK